MSSKLTQMRLWMREASTDEQKLLAHRAGTTRAYLYHLAAPEDSNYHREPRPALAASIESVTSQMHDESGGRLPKILRTDLVQACAQCEFARRCLGASMPAHIADFPEVEP